MAIERTFAIIKPDAVASGQQGEILSRIHKAGLKIVAIKSMRLTKEEAGGFYAVHKERPFFGELTEFMSSGKILSGATPWVPPTPKRLRQERFATIWAPASARTARTAPTLLKLRRLKSAISFPAWNLFKSLGFQTGSDRIPQLLAFLALFCGIP